MTTVQNPWHCQHGCALYVQWSIQMIYVKRQDLMEQMGDMFDSAMRWANVARRQEIGAHILHDSKNAPPSTQGKRRLDGVLRIKFSLASIE
jgi:hypothetical protein